jgi:hypothetical protein
LPRRVSAGQPLGSRLLDLDHSASVMAKPTSQCASIRNPVMSPIDSGGTA